MITAIRLNHSPLNKAPQEGVLFISGKEELSLLAFDEETQYFLEQKLFDENKAQYHWSSPTTDLLLVKAVPNHHDHTALEKARKSGAEAWKFLSETSLPKTLYFGKHEKLFLAFVEGVLLASYRFSKYKSEKKHLPDTLEVFTTTVTKSSLDTLLATTLAVYESRHLVNEPVITLDAVKLGEEIQRLGENFGFSTEILDKESIKELDMAGLLAVNLGSKIPPTFSILHHKPKKSQLKRPIILVGKGVVYDTGGLSLKPTPNSMDFMKADMAGAAAVIGAICAAAKLNLPVEVIGLVPATDNRPGENAFTPGDVITYSNGKSVEVLNTDAEGRLILADALIYAQKHQPELVIDMATLTGAAAAALGKEGAVMMGNAPEKAKNQLMEAGMEVHERLVEFPLWEEYEDQLKSDIADLKNIGGPTAGAITAGKFLAHFIAYDWIHIDIAGPSYLKSGESYKPAGGTGFGVRLITQFLKNIVK